MSDNAKTDLKSIKISKEFRQKFVGKKHLKSSRLTLSNGKYKRIRDKRKKTLSNVVMNKQHLLEILKICDEN